MKLLLCLLPIAALAMADEEVKENVDSTNVLTAANNAFTMKLFNEVAKNEKGKSVVMSGFSALSPLTQIALGSEKKSHDEILGIVGLPNDEVAKSAFSSLNRNLRSVKGVELKVANRIYIPEYGKLNESFAQMSRNVFGSDVKNVNFGEGAKAAATINEWVEESTNHLIKDLLSPDSLDSDTKAVLVNAIYFKGKWADEFNKRDTSDRDFHVSKEKTIKVPTMYKSSSFKYGESKELQAKLLELPYQGGEASLLIVLPNEIDGIETLQQKLLDTTLLSRASAQMYETEVEVFLPKFKIETTIDLKDVLEKVGIKKMFSPGEAELNYIIESERNLYVSNAIQKAFIEVNEEGTEAAAASELTLETRFGGSEFRFFIADTPFYFILRHDTKTIFAGIFTS